MSKFMSIMKYLENNPVPYPIIVPERSHKLYVYESSFDGMPDTDWMIICGPLLVGNEVVKQYAWEQSGLDEWKVVPGYPYQNADGVFEWRLRRTDVEWR